VRRRSPPRRPQSNRPRRYRERATSAGPGRRSERQSSGTGGAGRYLRSGRRTRQRCSADVLGRRVGPSIPTAAQGAAILPTVFDSQPRATGDKSDKTPTVSRPAHSAPVGVGCRSGPRRPLQPDQMPAVAFRGDHACKTPIWGNTSPLDIVSFETVAYINLMRRLSFLLVILVSVPLMRSSSVAGTPITTCGQEVDDAVLVSDLDCSAQVTGPALTIRRSLTMNGFTIRGSILSPDSVSTVAVDCGRKCEVIGPGAIVDSNGIGLAQISRGRLTVTDITVSGHAYIGIATVGAKLIGCLITNNRIGVLMTGGMITQSTITDNLASGVAGGGKAKISDSDVSGNGGDGIALSLGGAILRNTTVRNNADMGIRADRVALRGSTVSGNGQSGIFIQQGRRLRAVDSFITGNDGQGITIRSSGNESKLAIISTVVTGNHLSGIFTNAFFARTGKLKNSDFSGNCVAPSGPCADIRSCQKKLKLVNTTCGTSQHCSIAGMSLGICSLD